MIRKFVIRTNGMDTLYQIDTKKCFVQSYCYVTNEELENTINYCLSEGYEITKNLPKKEKSSINNSMYR